MARADEEIEDTMTKTWEQLRQEAIDAGRLDPVRLEALARWQLDRVRAHRLADVRKALGMNQVDVAASMHVSQARVSKIECGELATAQVGTLRAYVRALGGEVEVVARFGDERIVVAD
jgi:predicted XRE-type DNA-binding protein